MKIDIRKSFTRDAEKLEGPFRQQLSIIISKIEKAGKLSELENCKKLTGHKTAYRIRMGQYRICFYVEKRIVELVRVLHRKEVYRYFP